MPMPVSETVNCSFTSPSVSSMARTEVCTSPFSVNFTALLIRFRRICRSLPASPRYWPSSDGGIWQCNSMWFTSARRACSSTASSITWRSGNSAFSSSNRPASIFERSRISFKISSKASALVRTVSAYSCCSSESSESSSRSIMPIMPFIGVRISWLITARNWAFI